MICHEDFINLKLNPSGPGDLEGLHELTARSISSRVNGAVRIEACIGEIFFLNQGYSWWVAF